MINYPPCLAQSIFTGARVDLGPCVRYAAVPASIFSAVRAWRVFRLQTSFVFDNAQDLARDARIRELRAEGLSFKRIGQEFGITRQRVTQIWERMSKAPTEAVTCVCGAVLPLPSGPGGRRKYCSPECRHKATWVSARVPGKVHARRTCRCCGDCGAAYEAPSTARFCVECQSLTRARRAAYYGALIEAQGGVCAICGLPEVATTRFGVVRRLAVDHDHSTGAVRELLCMRCNTALGAVRDDPSILDAAAAYLRRHAAAGDVAA